MPGSVRDLWVRQMTRSGWSPVGLPAQPWLTVTRPLGEGLVAACSVRCAVDETTVRQVVVGVGHAPSTRLMPRLTLRPEVMFVGESVVNPSGGDSSDAARIPAADGHLDDLVLAVNASADDLAPRFAGTADLAAVLQEGYAEDQSEPSSNLVVLLAATDRLDAAIDLAHSMQSNREDPDPEFDRFVRQLELWVAAGAPDPPALEAWPPVYFQDTVYESRDQAREQNRRERPLRKAAIDAVRPHARTDSLDELATRLEHELAARGLRETRATTTMAARLLQASRWGRTKAGFTLLKTNLVQYKDSVHALRTVFGDEHTTPLDFPTPPAWATPPPQACFTPPTLSGEDITIDIAPEAEPTLTRLVEHSVGRRHPIISVDLWFDKVEDAKRIDVFIGNNRIGSLSDDDAEAMTPVFEAASRFHELPQLPGVLHAFGPPLSTRFTADKPAPFPPLPSF
jgi:hypothetical protein